MTSALPPLVSQTSQDVERLVAAAQAVLDEAVYENNGDGARVSSEFMDDLRAALASTRAPSTEREALERLYRAVAKIMPIATNDTPHYAELTFGDHQTQAMTMCPNDWNEIGAAHEAVRALTSPTGAEG